MGWLLYYIWNTAFFLTLGLVIGLVVAQLIDLVRGGQHEIH